MTVVYGWDFCIWMQEQMELIVWGFECTCRIPFFSSDSRIVSAVSGCKILGGGF